MSKYIYNASDQESGWHVSVRTSTDEPGFRVADDLHDEVWFTEEQGREIAHAILDHLGEDPFDKAIESDPELLEGLSITERLEAAEDRLDTHYRTLSMVLEMIRMLDEQNGTMSAALRSLLAR